MRHADHDLLYAQVAAALDDLLKRRDQRFGAVQAEALGAGEFEVAEFLEAFGFDQFHQNGAAAFAGETDFLVRPLDALLNPALLRGVADVHELDAEGLAIGALADRHDFTQRGVFHAEHVIEEDLAVEIAVHEPVGARVQFLAIAGRLDPERIELGVKVPPHPVGPDQHQSSHRIARRLMHIGRGQLCAFRLRFRRYPGAEGFFDFGPVAVESGGQLIARLQRPVVPPPGWPFGILQDVGRLVLQALEKRLPIAVDRSGVFLIASINLVDVAGVCALQK